MRLVSIMIAVFSLWSEAAASFPLQDDQTPGDLARQYRRRPNVWARIDAGALDGKVTSSPPDTAKLDRRLEALAITGFDAVLGRFGARMNAKAETSRRRQAEADGPQAIVDEEIQTYQLAADVTFVTDKGLEIFAGANAHQTPAYDQRVDVGAVSSKTTYESSTLIARRFGVVRRAGVWSGGFYYQVGAEKDRGFTKTASDGSTLSGEELAFVPARLGVFGEFAAGLTLVDFELAFVQSRGLGPKDERGHSIYTDHFEARSAIYIPAAGGLGAKLGVAHKTLSYASNAYVSLDTIPATAVRALAVFGEPTKGHAFFGLVYMQGEDGQSIPEFNATYEMKGAALTAGLFLPLGGGSL